MRRFELFTTLLVMMIISLLLGQIKLTKMIDLAFLKKLLMLMIVIYKSTCPENYIPMVMPPLNPASLPSMAVTFLTTRLMAVLQPSGYSVFHGGDTPIQLSLP